MTSGLGLKLITLTVGWGCFNSAAFRPILSFWTMLGYFWESGSVWYSKKLKFWSWTLVTQGIFVMTLLDNLSQKFAQKKHIFPSLIAKSFYKWNWSKIQRKNCFFSFFGFFSKFSFWWMILKSLAQFVWSIQFFWYPYWHT